MALPIPDLPQAQPFVFESRGAKALHFAIGQIQSRMQQGDPDALDLEYTRTMMGFLLFVPDPRDIAMIGLGGGSLAKFCHRFLPAVRIEVAEINPQVIALRDEFQIPADGERFSVLQCEGARFMRHPPRRFDALLIDGFDAVGMPHSLGTQRFYDDCREALKPDGVMVVNLHLSDKRHGLLVDRMRRSFDGAVLVVDDSEQCNSIAFACKGSTFATYRPGLVSPPAGLADAPAALLLAAFAAVVEALRNAARDRPAVQPAESASR